MVFDSLADVAVIAMSATMPIFLTMITASVFSPNRPGGLVCIVLFAVYSVFAAVAFFGGTVAPLSVFMVVAFAVVGAVRYLSQLSISEEAQDTADLVLSKVLPIFAVVVLAKQI